MPTAKFEAEWSKYRDINHLHTYEEKLRFWDLMCLDYGTGDGIIPYRPSCKAFEAFHRSKARHRTINSPNRNGKSLAANADIIPMAVDPRGGFRGWWMCEYLDTAQQDWEYVHDFIFKTDLYEWIKEQLEKQLLERTGSIKGVGRRIRSKNTPRPTIVIDWPMVQESRLEVWSYGDQSKWRKFEGRKLSLAYFVEGTQIPMMLWRRHLEKRLADNAGLTINPSTPKGEDEFMHRNYNLGLERKYVISVDYKKQEVTWHQEALEPSEHHVDKTDSFVESFESFHILGQDNPYWPIDDYNKDVKALFNGELDEPIFRERNFGEYVVNTGSFFDNIPEGQILNSEDYYHTNEDGRKVRGIHPDATFYRGVDIGAASISVCEWLAVEPPDKDGVENIVICQELAEPISYSGDLANKILEMTPNWMDVAWTIGDRRSLHRNSPASELTVEDIMIDAGLLIRGNPPKTYPKRTIDAFYRLRMLLRTGRVFIFKDKCPELVDEIRVARYGEGKYSDGHTQKNDELAKTPQDALDATCYAIFGNPVWREPKYKKEEREKKKVLPPNSAAYAFEFTDRNRNIQNGLFGKVGSY